MQNALPRRFLVVLAVLGPTGCAHDLARSSSGAIGCPPESIEISNISVGWSRMSWSAQCRGTQFYCSGEDAAQCTPEFASLAESPPPPRALPPTDPPSIEPHDDTTTD